MTVTACYGYVIAFCAFHSLLPTNIVNGEAGSKIRLHDIFLNNYRSEIVSLSWSCDVLLSNKVAGPNCGC